MSKWLACVFQVLSQCSGERRALKKKKREQLLAGTVQLPFPISFISELIVRDTPGAKKSTPYWAALSAYFLFFFLQIQEEDVHLSSCHD